MLWGCFAAALDYFVFVVFVYSVQHTGKCCSCLCYTTMLNLSLNSVFMIEILLK